MNAVGLAPGSRSEKLGDCLTTGRARVIDGLVLAAILVVALGLRLANAWHASLHLDDFHTLFHARAASFAEFLHGVRQDNHPPLFFWMVRAVRGLFGEDELVLRLPALLFGVATVPLVWRMGRRLGDRAARATAALLFACSSLNLELSADLRMYSLLTLAFAGFLDGVLDLLEGEKGAFRTALWTVVGLHTHYHFVHCLAVVLAAAALVFAARPHTRTGLRPLLLALGVAVLLSLPWYAWGFPAQLRHGLPPGGSDISLARFLEGLVHLVYLNVRLGGPLVRLLFLASGAIVLAFALLAGLRLLVTQRPGVETPAWFVLFAAAFVLPAWSSMAARIMPRAGFEWRYIAAAVVPLSILVASGVHGPGPLLRLRLSAAGLAMIAAFSLGMLNVFDPGREDNRGAVRAILARAREGDAVVAAEWQPRIFPHSGAWNYYAPRLRRPGQELPLLIEYQDDFTFPPGTDLSVHERVFFLGRSIPNDMPMLQALRREFGRETAEDFGMSICVVTFERKVSNNER